MRQKYPSWLSKISQDLAGVSGVIGVVLDSFYARGKGKKDSDFDLGIFTINPRVLIGKRWWK